MFLKLHEITKKRAYMNIAAEGISTFYDYFINDGWWAERVDSRTGKIMPNKNQTKYVGGALRFFIHFCYSIKNNSLYKNKRAYQLVRDR
jgi:hypothetical protein